MNPLQLLRSSGRRLAVVMCRDHGVPLVYGLHRVGAPEFLALAASALGEIRADAEQADELRSRLLGAKTDADRERVTAQIASVAAAEVEAAKASIMADPEKVRAMLAAVDALIMAAVESVGIGLPSAEPGLYPVGTRPETLCEPLAEQVPGSDPYLQPVRWGAGGLDLADMSVAERNELGARIVEAFKPTAAPFPARQGAAGDGGQVGKAVRPASKRARPVR